MTAKLVLIRHGFSEFNELNLFTGWYDAKLSPRGVLEAQEAGLLLRQHQINVDIAFTSLLSRAIKTCNQVLEYSEQLYVPLIKTWRFNEQHFGAMHGDTVTNREIMEFHTRPPALTATSKIQPNDDVRYRHLDPSRLPITESLADVAMRMLPFYTDTIYPLLKSGQNVLIVGHSNVLRSLIKHIEKLDDQAISQVFLETATPVVFNFDASMDLVSKQTLPRQKK